MARCPIGCWLPGQYGSFTFRLTIDFKSGRRKTIVVLEKSAWIGLTLSQDERYVLYSAVNNISRNLMLVDKID